jgi:hypothetical protein
MKFLMFNLSCLTIASLFLTGYNSPPSDIFLHVVTRYIHPTVILKNQPADLYSDVSVINLNTGLPTLPADSS